jgi:hypothetical protein
MGERGRARKVFRMKHCVQFRALRF